MRSVLFEYEAITIGALVPSLGPTAGSTLVLLHLSANLRSYPTQPTCHFGSSSTPASILSSRQLQCRTLALSHSHGRDPVLVPVRISVPNPASSVLGSTENSRPLSYDTQVSLDIPGTTLMHARTMLFRYERAPIISSIQPVYGPPAGGTRMIVYGAFPAYLESSEVTCSFQSMNKSMAARQRQALVLAVWLSATRVSCVSPRFDLGFVIVHLGGNGQNLTTSSGVYEYTPLPTVRRINPSSGPVGGSIVTVMGDGFRRNKMFCRFEDDAVPASVLSFTQIRCSAPTHPAGRVSFEFSSNAQQFTESGLSYTYEALDMLSIEPGTGPVDGGTILSLPTSELRSTLTWLPSIQRRVCLFR